MSDRGSSPEPAHFVTSAGQPGLAANGRPAQAVIVAGGRGERLRPLTDLRPKPMIEFHGKPFLGYLLDHLRENGFSSVLLLLGYRAGDIQEYVRHREDDGLNITCHVSDAVTQTGRRVWLARDQLDDRFLFLYCDNYWPMRWPQMWQQYVDAGLPAQITVYANGDGYSRDNVEADPRTGRVIRYDRSRKAHGLRGVEIGFAIMGRSILSHLDGRDVPIEDAVYLPLVERGMLGAFVTEHRYYSVGTHARLPETERFLARRPAVIVDRDGVLNERPPRAEYVRRPQDLHWRPGAIEALRLLNDADYRIIVASNQAGVARGAMSMADVQAVNARLVTDAAAAGGRIDAIYFCPHGWEEGCDCRKPRPGLLFQAQRDFALDLSRTVFVGDDERDAQAAEAAGSPHVLLDEDSSLLDVAKMLLSQSLPQRGVTRCAS